MIHIIHIMSLLSREKVNSLDLAALNVWLHSPVESIAPVSRRSRVEGSRCRGGSVEA